MDRFPAATDISLADTAVTEDALAGLCVGALPNGLSREIAGGRDPLGSAFARIRPADERRRSGATYTPRAVVEAMVSYMADRYPDASRIVDCGAGSGRFALEFAERFPSATVVAVERDPLAAAILRTNVAASPHSGRIAVVEADFRTAELPAVEGRTLFVGNPPYVRHHDIGSEGKEWLARTSAALGLKTNALSGLHVHFFVRVLQIARQGDAGLFITSAEWLESAFGQSMRQMLAGPLGGLEVFVLDPAKSLFDDAQVTSAVTEFCVGTRDPNVRVSAIPDIGGMREAGGVSSAMRRDEAAGRRTWSADSSSDEISEGMIRLGEMFSVNRGQVTGGNKVWIAGPKTPPLPRRFLTACVTRATDLIAAGETLAGSDALRHVVTLPADLGLVAEDEKALVDVFLAWAREQGGAESFTAKARKAWWCVAFKSPAPILCTYMGRRPPVFVRNVAGAAHVNIAHGLYPRKDMTDETLERVSRWLFENPVLTGGKTYGGGLRKFEPREIERIAVPAELFRTAD